MTDISAMLQTGVKIAKPGIASANPEESAAIEGFSELLALQIAGQAQPAPVAEAAPLPAALAPVLPESGKILPDGLAAPASEGESAEEAPAPLAAALIDPAQVPIPVATLLQPAALPIASGAEKPQTPAARPAAPQVQPQAAPSVAPPREVATQAAPVLTVTAPPVPIATLVQTAMPVAAMAAPVQFQVRTRAVPPAEGPRAQPAGEVAALAAPAASPLDLLRSRAPAEPAPLLPVSAPLAAAPLGDAPQPAQTVSAPAAPARAEAPMDFAQLVDRLVEARDAVRPQTVEAAIAHAEFGRVSLRFAQGEDGLSVTMASADPDFARVAQSAAAAVPPPQASAPAQSDTGSQGQPSAQRQDSASGQNPQQRGASEQRSERMAENRGPAASHARTDDAGDAPEARSGIFA